MSKTVMKKNSFIILTTKNEEQTHNIHLESVYFGPSIPSNMHKSMTIPARELRSSKVCRWSIASDVFVTSFIILLSRSLISSESFPSHIVIMFYSNGIWKAVLETSNDDAKCFRDVSSLFSHLTARCNLSGLIQFIFFHATVK